MRPPLLIALLAAGTTAALLLRPTSAPPPPATAPAPAPVTPETLAAEVETLRGLRFLRPLTFQRLSPALLEQKVRASMTLAVPPAEAALHLRTALALGLIRPGMEFDTADCLTGSFMEVPAALYDDPTATLYISEACTPDTRPDLIQRLTFQLARALLIQHGLYPLPFNSQNHDTRLTTLSLLHADAAITTQRHLQENADRIPAIPVPEVYPYHASPPFLRTLLAFPPTIADTFHRTLREKNPAGNINTFLHQIAHQPPRTTAELLHPELYPAPPPGSTRLLPLPADHLPLLTENTLGEFGLRTLFKTQLTAPEAETTATGLLHDHYQLYTGPAPGSDHLLWRTHWPTPEKARAFLHALAATHLGNAGIPLTPAHFPDPDTLRATTPTHTLLARTGPGNTITFAASPTPDTATRLLATP